jgi:hypothetical protein
MNHWQEYIPLGSKNSWDFPKNHSHQHAWDDIQNKGVTRNFNTKYNEKDHGPLKDTYKLNSNFKDFGPQVCFYIL